MFKNATKNVNNGPEIQVTSPTWTLTLVFLGTELFDSGKRNADIKFR